MEEKICGIYKVTNPKGKIYIGQSTDIKKRLNIYKKCRPDQPKLYHSIKKYGYENHLFEVIRVCGISDLNRWEVFYIRKYNSADVYVGLNLTHGGQSYFKHSEETRAKMSKAQTGNTKTLGRIQSKNEIAKRIAKTTGMKRSPEQRKRISIGHKGQIMTEETKAKLRISLKGINSKKVIDTVSGKIYKNPLEVCMLTGIKLTTFRAYLNGQNKNKTVYKYF